MLQHCSQKKKLFDVINIFLQPIEKKKLLELLITKTQSNNRNFFFVACPESFRCFCAEARWRKKSETKSKLNAFRVLFHLWTMDFFPLVRNVFSSFFNAFRVIKCRQLRTKFYSSRRYKNESFCYQWTLCEQFYVGVCCS